MKYILAGGAVVLFCLALAPSSDAGKKKGPPASEQPPRRDEMPRYMKMLTAGNSKDRAIAAHKIGLRADVDANDVADAVDPLRTALEKDSDAAVRKEAAFALGNIRADPKDTVPLLTKTVKGDKVTDVRLAATVALGQFGNDAKESLPTLREFAGEIKDKKSQQAQTITSAIKMISGKKK